VRWVNILYALTLVISGLLLVSYDVLADMKIKLATTTSTENSGLLERLLPVFENRENIKVLVIAVGTGQALKMGRDGDADVLLVHDSLEEKKFIEDGFGVSRREIMSNDFIIVGPREDPAKINGGLDAVKALKKIYKSSALFISRGDESGTHKAEQRLWRSLTEDVPWDKNSAKWYNEVGAGMGQTLNIAIGMGAYTITDRGTWIAFENKRGHKVMVEDSDILHNPYGVVLINKNKHPHTKVREARLFYDWLVGREAQKIIAEYKIDGQILFSPNIDIP